MTHKAPYDDIADWYETEFLAAQRRFDGHGEFADIIGIDQAVVELLGGDGGVCLEVGCGTGIYAKRVRDLGWFPLGVDISAGMLRHARQRLPVVQGDGRGLLFATDSIPAVVAIMIHTDIPDYRSFVSEIHRVLSPGGVFVHVGVHPCFCGPSADRTKTAERRCPSRLSHFGLDSGA
jgi:ubiquinone/menaquinone biosynthesis C-methylase UbiE